MAEYLTKKLGGRIMITQVKCTKCQSSTDDLWCNQYCQACWESFSTGVWWTVIEQLRGLGEENYGLKQIPLEMEQSQLPKS
ncbi:hypothetical protein [Leptothoe spongobia]|uniref:Uncharacterized protein n=1 Tax=Leptothoe spongobia TAU-MAC 1115 TaxID=1967444 RepID=A0A947DFH0_9CYAN|nr:hypothetical protein [Leptothoe spongobia]MBT9316073.1 hypothetical protein [Leptothoe spongobia TAU-MAC 1115]